MELSPVLLKIVIGVLCVLEIIVVVSFIKVGWPKRSNRSTLLKCTASIIFILIAVFSAMIGGGMTKIALIMLAGFVMSLIGDFCLDMELTDKNILMGIICFFFAHVFYLFAFINICQKDLGTSQIFSKNELIALAVLLVLAEIGSLIMKLNMRKLLVPVLIYAVAICTMVIKAVYMCTLIYQTKAFGMTALLTLSIGAALFVISDLVLATMYFGKDKFTKNMRIVNLLTYFSGQTLLALSMMYIVK